MSTNVVQLRRDQPTILTKKQLAQRLGRSERWVEQQTRRGLPVLEATDRLGRRRYSLQAVEAWLAEGTPRRSVEDRLAALERKLAELEGRAG